MKSKFIFSLALLFVTTKFFCQRKITEAEYKVYNAVLKEIFIAQKFETSHLPKEHTTLQIADITYNRILSTPPVDYSDLVSDTFFLKFEKLNEQKYSINKKKITVQVNCRFKNITVDFSRCHIEKDYAVVFVGLLFAPLNSQGAIYILKHNKATKTWQIERKIKKWAS